MQNNHNIAAPPIQSNDNNNHNNNNNNHPSMPFAQSPHSHPPISYPQQSQPQPQPQQIEDIPPVPEHNNNNNNQNNHHSKRQYAPSSNNFHSEEEKMESLSQSRPTNRAPHPRMSPPAKFRMNNNNYHQNRNMNNNNDPNMSVPYIEDEPSQSQSQPPNNKKKEIQRKIASLLFTKYPHAINYEDLYRTYQDYFGSPLEISTAKDIDRIIDGYQFIKREENPFANDYYELNGGSDPNNYYKTKHYFLELNDRMAFIKSFKRDKQLALIREKLNKHIRIYHPECLKQDQMKNMFKYFLGIDFDQLDQYNTQRMNYQQHLKRRLVLN